MAATEEQRAVKRRVREAFALASSRTQEVAHAHTVLLARAHCAEAPLLARSGGGCDQSCTQGTCAMSCDGGGCDVRGNGMVSHRGDDDGDDDDDHDDDRGRHDDRHDDDHD